MKVLFKHCKYVGIERLPPRISNKLGVCTETNRNIHAVMIYIEQTIAIRYPHITIFYICPRSYQAFVGSGKGGNRIQNKKNSWKTNTLSEFYKNQAMQLFGMLHSDSLEAAHIALYVHAHLDELLKSQPPRTSQNREFKRKELTCPVNMPPSKRIKPSI